jgi:Mrp family chromosome partitioning ATPase
MAPLEYLKTFRRRWRVIVACFAVAAAVGFILTPARPAAPTGSGFQATLTLIPTVDASAAVNLNLAAYLVTTNDVAILAAKKLRQDNPATLLDTVTAAANAEVGTLTITAFDPTAKRAAAMAEAFATATVEFVRTATVVSRDQASVPANRELAAVKAEIAELERKLAGDPDDDVLQTQLEAQLGRYGVIYTRVKELTGPNDTASSYQVLGTPQLSEFSSGGIAAPTNRRDRALLAGLLGLALGLGVAIAADRLDTRLREREEVEEAFGLPVLAEIPGIRHRDRVYHTVVMATRPDSAAAEGYRSLRSAVSLLAHIRHAALSVRPDQHPAVMAPLVIVVAGPRGDDGKTTTVANLAAALAEAGRTVLVIDCDFRDPEAQVFLDAPPGMGLADLLESDLGGNLDHVIRPTALRRVQLVTSGGAVGHPAGVLLRLSGIIAQARKRADVVLIDSGPLLVASDAVDLLQHADAALVTCRVGRTTSEQAGRVRTLLQRADVPLVGVVLLGVSGHALGSAYPGSTGEPSRWSFVRAWTRLGRPGGRRRRSPDQQLDVTIGDPIPDPVVGAGRPKPAARWREVSPSLPSDGPGPHRWDGDWPRDGSPDSEAAG